MIRVKICGITRAEDALVAAEAGADAVGFNFWPSSKRFIAPEDAKAIVDALPPFVTPVGVFVNSTEEEILEALSKSGCTAIQLHGDESPGFVRVFSRPVIKAFWIATDADIAHIADYTDCACLLDTLTRGSYGGSGKTGDWDLAAKVAQAHRVILAGGLTPDNVAEAVQIVRPYGVDVAGGVEKSPGIKDHRKIRAFITNARVAD